MKTIITGGRYYNDKNKLFSILDEIEPTIIIQGGASGADMLALEYATKNKIKSYTYIANWKKFGKAAGPIRNKQMCEDNIDALLVAFPGGKGTANCIQNAKELGLKIFEVI